MKKLNGNVLEFVAEAFIVPNHACPVNDIMENRQERIRRIAELNEIHDLSDDDQIVELWYVSKDDLGTSNLVDHGAHILNKNDKKIFFRPSIGLLPARLFEGHKEGDVIDVKAFTTVTDPDYPDDENTVFFLMHCKLNQLSYRYRRFGSFEETFDLVTRQFIPTRKKER